MVYVLKSSSRHIKNDTYLKLLVTLIMIIGNSINGKTQRVRRNEDVLEDFNQRVHREGYD